MTKYYKEKLRRSVVCFSLMFTLGAAFNTIEVMASSTLDCAGNAGQSLVSESGGDKISNVISDQDLTNQEAQDEPTLQAQEAREGSLEQIKLPEYQKYNTFLGKDNPKKQLALIAEYIDKTDNDKPSIDSLKELLDYYNLKLSSIQSFCSRDAFVSRFCYGEIIRIISMVLRDLGCDNFNNWHEGVFSIHPNVIRNTPSLCQEGLRTVAMQMEQVSKNATMSNDKIRERVFKIIDTSMNILWSALNQADISGRELGSVMLICGQTLSKCADILGPILFRKDEFAALNKHLKEINAKINETDSESLIKENGEDPYLPELYVKMNEQSFAGINKTIKETMDKGDLGSAEACLYHFRSDMNQYIYSSIYPTCLMDIERLKTASICSEPYEGCFRNLVTVGKILQVIGLNWGKVSYENLLEIPEGRLPKVFESGTVGAQLQPASQTTPPQVVSQQSGTSRGQQQQSFGSQTTPPQETIKHVKYRVPMGWKVCSIKVHKKEQ